MRIAISGSHRTGKSTLIEELSRLLPEYRTVNEPYLLMEEDGHEFSHPPAMEDFEAQLERSIEDSTCDGHNVLFDRAPVDFLAYISVHEDADMFDLDDWLPRVQAAMQALDLIVFVPVEVRDRITFSSTEDDGPSRAAVDEKLKEILLEDPYELGVEILEVEGEIENRARTVMQRIRDELRGPPHAR